MAREKGEERNDRTDRHKFGDRTKKHQTDDTIKLAPARPGHEAMKLTKERRDAVPWLQHGSSLTLKVQALIQLPLALHHLFVREGSFQGQS